MDQVQIQALTEDQLKPIMSEKDYVLMGDMSGSMGEPIGGGKTGTRWNYMSELFKSFGRYISTIDDDGIDVVFFGGAKVPVLRGVKKDDVSGLFDKYSPDGRTPTAEALKAAFSLKKDKDLHITCFTDGAPNDEKAVIDAILEQTKRQKTDGECTVLFIQIGTDPEATKSLKKLDDGLKALGAQFDIVDVMSMDELEGFPSIAHAIAKSIDD